MNKQISNSVYGAVVAQAWASQEFQNHLVARPAEVLREQGWALPAGVAVVVEPSSSSSRMVFGLPPKPDGLSLDEFGQPTSATACCSH